MKRLILALLAALFALPGLAGTLDELRLGISGQEVEIKGYIGAGLNLMDPEQLSFRDEGKAIYQVVFDAGRDARKKLEGCKFEMFGGTPCAMTGKAEIELDGANIRLIIFELGSIAAPAKLPN